MGKRGPPKTTAVMKELCGSRNRGPDEDGVQWTALTEPPDPPSWLTKENALEFWHKQIPTMTACGLIGDLHVPALGHLCMLHSAILSFYEDDEIPPAALYAQYVSLSSQMGLTLAGGSRIKLPDRPQEKNPFLD